MIGPRKIICLTEEPVEWLYLLGEEKRIAGISRFVKRPPGAAKAHPRVTAFIKSDIEKILRIRPDLVIGFSDIQKDIARELIAAGLNVFIANQRSLSEILDYLRLLASMVGRSREGEKLVSAYEKKMEAVRKSVRGMNRPYVYFEEWNDPMISAIRWVSELIDVCGGRDIFAERSHGVLAKNRFVTPEEVIAAEPQIIFGCWCGKKVKIREIMTRPGWEEIPAVRNRRVMELAPEIFLQPGPALFEDGLDLLSGIIRQCRSEI